MQAFTFVCMISFLISDNFGRFNTPTDPVFIDDVTDYDSPSGVDYYDVKDFPMLPGEWGAYRKTKPGGLLPSSDVAVERKVTPTSETTTTVSYRPTRKPRKKQSRGQTFPRPSNDEPMMTTAAPQCILQRTTSKPSWRREGDRLIIDGSDPNTDLFKIMRESRRRPTETPNRNRRFPMRDIVGNEIKPETASNRFLVLGSVRRCRETKQEVYEHITRKSRIENPDPTVTGLTVEIPSEIPRSMYKFENINTGGKMFEFQTMSDEQGSIRMKWYSCPTRNLY